LATVVIVTGVSGAGKSTAAEALARRRGWRFVEADDLHPAANVAKMRAGIGLDEEDRTPWLEALAGRIRTLLEDGDSAVIACSALRWRHRRILRVSADVRFVYLQVSPTELRRRLTERRDHYAGPELLVSQFEALEAPDEHEAILVPVADDDGPEDVVERVDEALRASTD